MKLSSFVVVLFVSCSTVAAAWGWDLQEPDQQVAHESAVESKLSQFNWIAGQWEGEAMGGQFEESWASASGGSLLGMFKLVRDNEVVFYEILTIVEEDDEILLRLKHFDSKLVGWEEKDKSLEFPLVSYSETEIVFKAIRFEKIDENKMIIYVKINSGGKTQLHEFVCHRVKHGR